MNGTPRMRTIKQAICDIKAQDSSTAFTESALRRAIACGQIPHLRAGNKILVNLDTVESYLAGNIPNNDTTKCKIRALS